MTGVLSTAPNSAIPAGARRKAEDAQPKSLYVNRPLTNASTLRAWAEQAGFKNIVPDMHVTVAFSKDPVDWSATAPAADRMTVPPGGARKIERLGEGAVVLSFESPELAARWQDLRDAGAKWDYPEYKPHVTLSYDAGDIDLDAIAPYDGQLDLAPEEFAEIKARDLGATDSALTLALDRDSVREKDRDGRLRVSMTNISKANVCPYRGKEIPGWEKLGLEPERIYNLLRHPDELKKGAESLNGVPLLRKHVPVNAEDHQPHEVVGSLGTDAQFDGTYLKNSIFVNAKDAIDGIESGKKRELSAGYHYTPDMTAGNFDGRAFDGVMRDIVFNHVALVEDGRAGPDVVVGDSMENVMKPTRYAALVLAATAAHIAPLLAMDSKVTLSTDVFKKITPKNFKDSKAALLTGVRASIDGKLRQGLALDATMGGLAKAIDAFEELENEAGDDDLEEIASVDPIAAPQVAAPEDKTNFDAGPVAEFLRGKGMGEDDIKAVCDMLPKAGAMDADETDEEKAAREKKEADAKTAKDAEMKDKDKKDGQAMDAAISTAVTAAEKRIRETERGIRVALAEVKPWVGELPASMAFDTAADVLRHAATMMNIEGAKTLHADALLPVIKAQPKPGARAPENNTSQIAMDASVIDAATKIAPGLANIQNVA